MGETRVRAVEVEAPAKVNLTLRVLERRPDGFHELQTLFQAVGLADQLRVERRDEPGVALEVRGADVGPAEDNLVTRAARSFFAAAGLDAGAAVTLEKRIPAGAGLGGGSADAAATLAGLSRLFDEPLPAAGLLELAAALGSDVPFFLCGSPLALGEGRGERLTPLPALPEAGVVLAFPDVHVATGAAYVALAEARREGGGGAPAPLELADAPWSWERVARLAVNDFQDVVRQGHPEVGRAVEALRARSPRLALLSGSGAAVFAVFADLAAARRAAAEARKALPGMRVEAVPTLSRMPELRFARAEEG